MLILILLALVQGFCAGISVTLVGHPFETVKASLSYARVFSLESDAHLCSSCIVQVRLQTQPSGKNAIYKGFVDCVAKTIKWEGPQVCASLEFQVERCSSFHSLVASVFFLHLSSRVSIRAFLHLSWVSSFSDQRCSG